MPRDWRSLVDTFTRVQRLVHLTYRMDSVDEEALRSGLLKNRRRFYEDELTEQAARVGCSRRRGRLAEGPSLTELNEASQEDAVSVVNTFNYDLAVAILAIFKETPTANRYVYASRLGGWEAKRNEWKQPQITQHTEVSARAKAQQDFYRFNSHIIGVARLSPKTAICPICKGWVARGEVPIRVAQNNPPPYHVNCLPPDALVTMVGSMSAQEVSRVEVGDRVATSKGASQVRRVFRRQTEEDLYCLEVAGQVLRLTGDHPVMTRRGWVPAQELEVTTEVLALARGDAEFREIETIEVKDYVGLVFSLETGDGEFIANGIVVHNCPHTWSTNPKKVARAECSGLWMGG